MRSRRQELLSNLPYLLVMAIVLAGFVLIWLYHWRRGTLLIGGALVTAAVMRVVLPDERAGLLAIRGKQVDAMLYGGLAILLMFIAATIVRTPPG